MSEQLQNGPGSATLNGALNSSATSVPVSAVSGNLPASGTYSINIYKLTGTVVSQFETMRVLSVSSNTLTVATRSSGVAHDDGSIVAYTLDILSIQQLTLDRDSGEVALADGATIGSSWATGAADYVTIAGNRILSNPSGATAGQRRTLRAKQDATGGRLLTLGTKFRAAPAAVISGASFRAWWSFDQSSGAAVDQSGNASNATLHGAATYAAGLYGNALSLDGNIADYADPGYISLPYPFSLGVWFNAVDVTSPGMLLTWGKVGNNTPLRYLYVNAGILAYEQRDDASTDVEIDSGSISTGTWYHALAVSAAANDHKLYLNGSLVASSTASLGTSTFDITRIGNQYRILADASPFNGLLDDLRLYSSAKTAAEAAAIYNRQVTLYLSSAPNATDVADILYNGVDDTFQVLGVTKGF